MTKSTAQELQKFVDEVARRYSNPDREMNNNNEVFEVDEIVPTSDHTASVFFKKSSGKVGVAFFYLIGKGASRGWRYFFPTDSHVTGMLGFTHHKLEAERRNYKHNFDD